MFLFAGQLMSVCLAASGIFTYVLINRNGINIVSFELFLVYFLLLIISAPLFVLNNRNRIVEVFKKRGWKYIFTSIIYFEVLVIITKAFQFTNYASIQLIDTLTIPFALFLSICILKTQFYPLHYVGGTIAIIGLISLTLVDLNGNFEELRKGSNIVMGNVMCVASAFFYSLCNVISELIMKKGDFYEWLFFMSLYGSIFSSIQSVITDRKILSTIVFNQEIILLIASFMVTMAIFYMLLPFFISKFGSATLNLSLLTIGIIAIGYGASLKNNFTIFQIISIFLIVGGLILFQAQTIYLSQKNRTLNINRRQIVRREEST